MDTYKYKVHSAIYSCNNTSSNVKAAYDVTKRVQAVLNRPDSDGLLKIDGSIIKDMDLSKSKCFAIIVTVVYPDGRILTRFCTAVQDSLINIKESGTVCSF